jgi:hypothetical protein
MQWLGRGLNAINYNQLLQSGRDSNPQPPAWFPKKAIFVTMEELVNILTIITFLIGIYEFVTKLFRSSNRDREEKKIFSVQIV